jgi:sugar lactone lactonase YvrE
MRSGELVIEAIQGTPAVFAECPVWLPDCQRLCFVDCAAGRLFSLDWRSRAVVTVIARPGSLFLGLVKYDDRRVLLLTGEGAFVVDMMGNVLPFALPDEINPGLINDGKCDRAGRLWIGEVRSSPDQRDGSMWCLSSARSGPSVCSLGIPNGPAFAPAGDTLYLADSLAGTIEAFALDPSGGLSHRRRILSLPASKGQPDGMTVDAGGRVISAVFDGGLLLIIDPIDAAVEPIQLPNRRPTSCTFGGPDQRTLFVTVANGPWPQDRRHPEQPPPADPKVPSLYAIAMPSPGLPEVDLASVLSLLQTEVPE